MFNNLKQKNLQNKGVGLTRGRADKKSRGFFQSFPLQQRIIRTNVTVAGWILTSVCVCVCVRVCVYKRYSKVCVCVSLLE